MSRKKKHEEHANHERWAIPYADLITLLLALFVVLYAVSAVNTSKFKAMSQAMTTAFNGTTRSKFPSVEQTDGDTSSLIANHGTTATTLTKALTAMKVQDEESRHLDVIQSQVEKALRPLIQKGLVNINRGPTRLEIEIRTDILFASGVAQLAKPADDILDQIAAILEPFTNPVRIEGYTDDVPINTALYPSNWELSAGRAASVARLFAQDGVDSKRLGIEGWADNKPAGDNSTEDGRNRNRRVLVVVLGNQSGADRFIVTPDNASGVMQADVSGKPTVGPAAVVPPVLAPPAPVVAPVSAVHDNPTIVVTPDKSDSQTSVQEQTSTLPANPTFIPASTAVITPAETQGHTPQ